jgi:cupin fold WbuC family metalloprotein
MTVLPDRSFTPAHQAVEEHGHGWFDEIRGLARTSPRKRAHKMIHHSIEEPCQRLVIALDRGTYIPPHRHLIDPKRETMIALQGLLALITVSDGGGLGCVTLFGSEAHGGTVHCPVAVTVADDTWHTVVPVTETALLMEVKPGPFRPDLGKEPFQWAPEEGAHDVNQYLDQLQAWVRPALQAHEERMRRLQGG